MPTDRPVSCRRSALLATVLPLATLSLLLVGACASPSPTPPAESAPAQPAPPPDGVVETGAESDREGASAAPSATQPASAGDPAAAPAFAGEVRCFFGSTVQRQPEGAERPGADLLVRRTLQPAESRIVEDSVRFDDGAARTRRYRVVLEVEPEAGTFDLAESNGEYRGTGRLEGEPWTWDAWTYSYRLNSGIAVEGRSEIATGGADGDAAILTSEKTAYGPDGGLALTLVETLREISPAECERRLRDASAEGEDG